MINQVTPIILSGGVGSRLWPLSNHKTPKQFLNLGISSNSLLQETLLRVAKFNPALIVSNQEHRFLLKENLQKVNYSAENILLEPYLRNTAPAIACAALYLQAKEPDALMLVLPADHLITNTSQFEASVEKASILGSLGYLVTFGVQPTHPETGYGYLKKGENLGNDAYLIEKFVEKPDQATAQHYLTEDYLWNSGMFLFSAKTYLQELRKFHPKMLENCQASLEKAQYIDDFCWLEKTSFRKNENISIDYAIMEHTRQAAVIPLDCEWTDAGNWESLWNHAKKPDSSNAKIGEVYEHDSKNSYIHAHQIPITTLGVDNLVIISSKNMVLVADKSRSQEIKPLMEKIIPHTHEGDELNHSTIRPWGKYDVLAHQKNTYKIKQVTVKSGEKLSIQKHYKRDEHWTILEGSASVTIDHTRKILHKNDHIHIEAGTIHSIENIGKSDLVFIEVQTGSYLGEDDIVRYDDKYGRAGKNTTNSPAKPTHYTRLESQIAELVMEETTEYKHE